MDTLQKVTTPSSACNETYYYKKSHSNVAFFCRCGRTHALNLVNICLDIRLPCKQV